MSLTGGAHRSDLVELAIVAESPESLLDSLFLRFLARLPSDEERTDLLPPLRVGFDQRLLAIDSLDSVPLPEPLPQVTWTNHLVPEANEIQLDFQQRVLQGPPVDPRLEPAWREVYEDVVWSLVNHREFAWVP